MKDGLDFIKAALPWILMGFSLIFVYIRHRKDSRSSKNPEPAASDQDSNEDHTYQATGLCIGVALGLSIGQLWYHNLAAGLCIGISLGLVIGSAIPKKHE